MMEFTMALPNQDKNIPDISKSINSFIEIVTKQKEDLIKDILLTKAIPPIKGEVTLGKIRWRGITFHSQRADGKQYMWVEQRGKRISPKFESESFYRQHDDAINSNTVNKEEEQ